MLVRLDSDIPTLAIVGPSGLVNGTGPVLICLDSNPIQGSVWNPPVFISIASGDRPVLSLGSDFEAVAGDLKTARLRRDVAGSVNGALLLTGGRTLLVVQGMLNGFGEQAHYDFGQGALERAITVDNHAWLLPSWSLRHKRPKGDAEPPIFSLTAEV